MELKKLLQNHKNKKLFVQFIKFGIVGVSNTLISYGIYSGLVYLKIQYLIASVAGFIISVLNSFFWNDRYVFKKNEGEVRSTWKSLLKTFTAYALTGLILNNVFLVVFIELFKINKYIAPLLGLLITVPLNFLINKFWSFREKINNEKN
jgi:putative flippase GtrA